MHLPFFIPLSIFTCSLLNIKFAYDTIFCSMQNILCCIYKKVKFFFKVFIKFQVVQQINIILVSLYQFIKFSATITISLYKFFVF